MFIEGEYRGNKKRKKRAYPKNNIDCCMRCANANSCSLRCSWAFEIKCLNTCVPGGCEIAKRKKNDMALR